MKDDFRDYRQARTSRPYAHPSPYLTRFNSVGHTNGYGREGYAVAQLAPMNANGAARNGAPGGWTNAFDPLSSRNAAPTITRQSRHRSVSHDEVAVNDEMRLRRDRAAVRPPTPVTSQWIPCVHLGDERGIISRDVRNPLALDVEQNERTSTLPTPPQSPSITPSHPRPAAFKINIPIDTSQPFTFTTEDNNNDEFPSLSDLIHPSQSHPPPVTTSGPPPPLMQQHTHCRLPFNVEVQSYNPPVVYGQSVQHASLLAYYTALNNQGNVQPLQPAPVPATYDHTHYLVQYSGGFARSSAPSPSPYVHPLVEPTPVQTPTDEIYENLPLSGGQFSRVLLWLMSLPKSYNGYENPFTTDHPAEP